MDAFSLIFNRLQEFNFHNYIAGAINIEHETSLLFPSCYFRMR